MKKIMSLFLVTVLTISCMAFTAITAQAAENDGVIDSLTDSETFLLANATRAGGSMVYTGISTGDGTESVYQFWKPLSNGYSATSPCTATFTITSNVAGKFRLKLHGGAYKSSKTFTPTINGTALTAQSFSTQGNGFTEITTMNTLDFGEVDIVSGTNTIVISAYTSQAGIYSISLETIYDIGSVNDSVTITVEDSNCTGGSSLKTLTNVSEGKVKNPNPDDLTFTVNSLVAGQFNLSVRGAETYNNTIYPVVNSVKVGEENTFPYSGSDADDIKLFTDISLGIISLNEGTNTIQITKGSVSTQVYVRSITLTPYVEEVVEIQSIDTEENIGKYKVSYEAEAADSDYNWVKINGTTTEAVLTYDVDCKTAGTYYFTTFLQRNYSSSDVSVTVYNDENAQKSFDCGGVRGWGSDTSAAAVIPGFTAKEIALDLTKGKNTITVKFSQNLAIDKFELTNYERSPSSGFVTNSLTAETTFDVLEKTYRESPRIATSKVYAINAIPNGTTAGTLCTYFRNTDAGKGKLITAKFSDGVLNSASIVNMAYSVGWACGYFIDVDFTDTDDVKVFIWNEEYNPLAGNIRFIPLSE